MAAQNSKTRSPLRPCAIKGCEAAPRRRKYCPGHSKTAPMRTLAREGAWSTLAPAKPVVAKAAPAKKSRTRTARTSVPQARKVAAAQVKTAKAQAQARVETVAGQQFVLVDGVAYRIAS